MQPNKTLILTDGKSQNIYLNAPLFDGEIADLVGGKAEKKHDMVVFDGSADESWTEGSYSSKKYYATDVIPDAKKTSTIKCSYNSSTSTVVADENAFINDVGKVVLCTQGLSNVDALKTKLAANPMIVVYPLSAPTTESFDGSDIPTSVTEQELELNTEITPASIESTTFGDYYSKVEVDKLINDLDTRLKALEPSATSLDED